MALSLLAANNAQTVLAAGISSTATSLTVNAGTGTLFPSPVAGSSFFKLTIIDAATGTLTEIIHVTARNGDVFTIQRGQEGTVPRAWSANDIVANMMTAGTLSYIFGNFQPLDPTLTALAALVGVANKLPYFNGADTAALTDLTQVGRDIIGKSDVAAVLQYLGLAGAAKSNVVQVTGTSKTDLMSQDSTTKELAKKINADSAASLSRLTTTSQDAIRMKSADYGVLLHQNNTEFFILMTNEKDPDGNYNDLRPFRITLKSGVVSISSLTLGALNLQDFTPFDNRYLKKDTTASDLKVNYGMFVFESNQTWTVPSEFVGRKAKVTVCGAGGGGSSKVGGSTPRGGMMGGNGGMSIKILTLSTSHSIVAGAAGNGGTYSGTSTDGTGGSNGTSSSFDSVSATGGQGASSQAAVGANNGTPGYGIGGDINIVGGGGSGGAAGCNNATDPGNGRNGTKGYVIVEVMP